MLHSGSNRKKRESMPEELGTSDRTLLGIVEDRGSIPIKGKHFCLEHHVWTCCGSHPCIDESGKENTKIVERLFFSFSFTSCPALRDGGSKTYNPYTRVDARGMNTYYSKRVP
jgi:hypothetical protein